MTTPETYYTGRLPLPDFLVRGADTNLSLSVYRDGALSTMTAATVTVYDSAGTVVVTASATVAANVASYTVLAAATAAKMLSDGWRVEWDATLSAGVEHFRNDAHLVRTLLRPVITDADIYRRVSALDASDNNALASKTNYQNFLDEAWVEFSQRLIDRGNRPNLIGSPSSTRGAHLYLTLALIFEDMSARDPASFSDRAASYRRQYESQLQRLTFKYPADENGNTPASSRRGAGSTVFLCSSPGRRW